MSILVYAENTDGFFKKSTLESLTYAVDLSKKGNESVTALCTGNISAENLKTLGEYGTSKVLYCKDERLNSKPVVPLVNLLEKAAIEEKSSVIIFSHTSTGAGIAPRLAVKLKAGVASNVISLPDSAEEFSVIRGVYSGKGFSRLKLTGPVKILTIKGNSHEVKKSPVDCSIVDFNPSLDSNDFSVKVKELVKTSGKVSLKEADVVVSGGRGMKGPENWQIIEELAGLLKAATSCSKPVADMGWRPHSEHVGQTGITVGPNLYIAIGISGAIQHLAGVNSSKTIVVINKDPEAPFFKAADFGIVGDAFEVVPRLIKALKERKN
ncbi:MAG: electron transfer flavoprotein subunit alpha [Bacteroidetes bacterium RIFCSPLOWO2_12_FULL_37_12]|nr:MAG: electron transfer flavoprotein subunit alpha [Bacteroidetes bacterium RIFCSPLOWO2_12_FULL_37_12]